MSELHGVKHLQLGEKKMLFVASAECVGKAQPSPPPPSRPRNKAALGCKGHLGSIPGPDPHPAVFRSRPEPRPRPAAAGAGAMSSLLSLQEENRILQQELSRVEDLLAQSRAERDELAIKYNAISERVGQRLC